MSKAKSSTSILRTVAAFLMLMAAVALSGPQSALAQGQTTSTGALLVDLDASALELGTLASWANAGTLGGEFTSSTANPVVETVQGVKAVTFNNNAWLKSNFLTTDDMTSTSDWSVEIWVLNPSVGGDEGMLTWANRGEENRYAACCYSTAAGWGAFAGWGAGDIGYKDAIPPTAGIWHHIAFTYAGGANGNLAVYVDGQLNTQAGKSLNIHGPWDDQATPIFLATATWADRGLDAAAQDHWFSGSISKVRMHGGMLSAAQVAANYDVEKADYLASALTVTAPVSGGLYYGSVATGSESAAQTVTIKNVGTTDLTFDTPAAEITGDAADQYSIVPGFDTAPLAPGQTRSIQVTLKPTTDGFKAAQLVFNTDSAVTAPAVNLLGGTPTALNTAGDVLVNLKSDGLANGPLTTWTNEGTLGGHFFNPAGTVPAVGSIQGVRSVAFNSTWLKSNFLTTAAFTGTSDWSLETWVYNPEVAAEEQVVTWSNRGEENQNAAFIYGTEAGWGAFGGWGAGDIGFLNATPPAAARWHLVTITYGGGANSPLRVYVNGILNNSKTANLNIHGVGDGQAMPIILGGSTGDNPNGMDANAEGWWYTGSIAAVRFHDNALTPAQVYSNFLYEQVDYAGDLQVNISPAEAVAAGAKWRFSTDAAGVWRDSGERLTNMTAQQYTIEYKAVPGWQRRPDETIVAAGGVPTTIDARFQRQGAPLVYVVHEDMGQQAKVEAFLKDTYGQNVEVRWFEMDTRFDYFLTKNRNMNTAFLAELNAANLIIVSRNVTSGEYASNADETAAWDSITAPMIVHSTHMERSDRWNWVNTAAYVTAAVQDIDVAQGADPLFDGVTVNGGKVRIFNIPTNTDIVDTVTTSVATALYNSKALPLIQRWDGTEANYYPGSPRSPKGPRLMWAAPGGGDFITALTPAGLKMYRNALTQYAAAPYVNAQPLNFGIVRAGGAAVSKTTVITNQSDTDLVISGGELTGDADFAIKAIALNGTLIDMSAPVTLSKAAGDTLAVTIEFTPSVEAKRQGQIVLTTNDPAYPTTSINVAAVATTWVAESMNGNPGTLNSIFLDGNKAKAVVSGGDIWNNADQAYFAYKKLSGDGDIVVRVDYLDSRQGSGDWTKAGIDMRETPTGASKHVFIGFVTGATPGTQVAFRTDTNGGSADQTDRAGQKPPYWLRLRRVGNVITPAYSPDGIVWTWRDSRTVAMATDIYVGLCLTSNNGFGGPIRADFSNISVTGNVSSVPTQGQAPASALITPNPVAFGTLEVGSGVQTRTLKISNTASPFVNARTIQVASVTKTLGDVFTVGQPVFNNAPATLPVSLLAGGCSTLEIPISINTALPGAYTGMMVLMVDGIERGVELKATVSEPTAYTNPVTDGLAFALDASALTGLQAGEKVTAWVDGSGNGYDAVMAEPSRRPVYYPNATNGQPAVRFDGGDDYLNTAAMPGLETETTVFAVSRVQSNSSTSTLFTQMPDNKSNRFQVQLPRGGDNWPTSIAPMLRWDFGGDTAPGSLTVPASSLSQPMTAFNVWTFASSPLLPGQQILQNNKVVASDSNADILAPTNSSLRIGNSAGPDTDEGIKGDIAELLIYNRKLTDEETNAVGFYLQSKYGTPYGFQNPAQGPQVTVSPVSAAFGTMGVSDAAKSVTFTIQNVGNGSPALNIASVVSSSPAFAITSAVYKDANVEAALAAPYAASLAGDLASSLKVTVTFDPAGKTAGGYSGVLQVASNDPASPTVELPLTALVTASPVGAGLMIHLDASQIDPANTDLVLTAADGAQRVRRWPDLSPTGRTASQIDPQRMPLLVPGALNGKPVVRFDGLNNENGDLVSYSRIAGRTFILVMKEAIRAEAEPRKTFIGDSSSADFHRGPRNLMVDRPNGWSAAQVRNGDAWLNGQWIDCTMKEAPYEYSVLSFRTLSNASTDQLARDRTYGDRFWAGDVAEYLVYDRPLSAEELNAIGYYLQQKYFPGKNYFVPTTAEGGLWAEPQAVTVLATEGHPVEYREIKLKHVGATGETEIASIDASQMGIFTLVNAQLNGQIAEAPYTLAAGDELVVCVAVDPAVAGTYKGTLTIHSDDPVRPACAVALRADVVGLPVKNGLSLYLDASKIDKTDPWQVTNRDGQNYVSVWPDLSGTNRQVVSNTPAQQPVLVDNAINGLPVVRLDGQNNVGDYMRWWPENRTLRTVFMVMKENTGTNDGVNRHILTGSDSADFHRGDVAGARPVMISSQWAGSNVINAPAAAVDGVSVDLKATPPPVDSLKIVSITTAGDAIAGGIGRDRTFGDRYFAGDYAEILLYDRVLTEWEMNAVGYYLKTKYNLTNATYTEPAGQPAIEVTPSVLDLGTVAADAGEQSGVLKIRNVGSAGTTLDLSGLDFTNMGLFQVTEVLLNGTTPLSAPYAAALTRDADDFVEVHVTFDPAAGVAGSQGGWFTASSNDATRPAVTVGVSATVAGMDATTWRAQDVGDPALKGGFEQRTDGSFRMVAGGADIWGNKDEFHFAYKQLHGDGSITARVRTMNASEGWAKAGVMIRETLAGGSPNAANLKTGTDNNGVTFQRRFVADQGSSSVAASYYKGVPVWVRLVRQGDVFSAYYSADGVNWSLTDLPRAIPMANTVYIGLSFTSHNTGSYGEIFYDNVTLTGGISDILPEEITADPIAISAFPYRARVTTVGFDSAPTQNREVLVKLGAATVADFTSTTFTSPTDGADLRFVAADKTTPLPFKIVSWNPSGESSIWVRTDEITDTDSHFYAIWGADEPTTPTYNDNVTWTYSPMTAPGYLAYTRVITDGQVLTADAGDSTTATLGATVALGGSSTTAHVLYKWEVLSTPADPAASVTLATPKAASTQATVANNVVGDYVLQLTVSDDFNTPSVSTVTLTVENDTPVVNAGSDAYINAGSTLQLNGSATDKFPGAVTTTWSLVGPGSWTFVEGTPNTLNPKVQFPDVSATYTVRLTADDGQGGVAFDELTVYVVATSGIIYVNQAATAGDGTGYDWANGCLTIAEGLQLASQTGAGQIWVAAGLYNESVTLPSGIQLIGGFAGTESSVAERNLAQAQSTINAAGAASVVTLNNVKNTRVDGFTLTGGAAANGAGLNLNAVDATNVIANCEILGNRATGNGGGVYLYASSPTIVNCVIAGNEATNGAAVYCQMLSKPAITNCTIADNEVNTKGAVAVTEWSAPVLKNNILAGNPNVAVSEESANAAAGLVNNLFWLNGTADYYDFGAAQPNTTGTAVNSLPGATGNVFGDPLFAGGATGVWTAEPVYDGANKVTTLVDAAAAFTTGSLVGSFIETSATVGVQAYIVDNTATEIVVLGDATGLTTVGAEYQFTNYALTAGSAALDAGTAVGAPAQDIVGVTRPANGVDDIGAYELQKSQELVLTGSLDFNGSSALDFGSQVAGAGPTTPAQTVEVKNNGTAPLTVTSVALTGADAADFTIGAVATPVTLAVGDTLAVSVAFDPATVGVSVAALEFVAGAETYVLPLTGTASPAVPTGLDLVAATDTGASDSDNVTNLSIVTITATAPAGTEVRLYDDGGLVLVDTAENFATGVTLDFNASSAIAVEGPHNLTAVARDVAEDIQSLPSDSLHLVVDRTAPLTYGLNLAADDDTGLSNSDRVTKQASGLTIYGVSDFSSPDTQVVLSQGATVLASGTAQQLASGLDVALAEGTQTVTAVATDLAGNVSLPAEIAIEVDLTKPEVADNAALTASPAQTSTVDFGVQFTQPVVTFDNPLTDVTVDATNGLQYASVGITPVTQSEYIVTVDGITSSGVVTMTVNPSSAMDIAGNYNSLAVVSDAVTVDNNVPVLLAEPAWTAGTENTVAWEPMAGATSYTLMRALDANQASPETVVVPGTATSHTLTGLTDGVKYYYFLAAMLQDATTLTAWSAPVFSTQDATSPVALVELNGGADYTAQPAVTVTLDANDTQGAAVYSGVGEMRYNQGAGWSAWKPFNASQPFLLEGADGVKVVEAQVRDRALNVSAFTSASIILDRAAPAGTVTPTDLGPVYGDTVTYVVAFNEPVTGFETQASSLVLTATEMPNAAPITYTGVAITAQSATTYTVTVSGIAGSGNLALSVPAGLADDLAGNANGAFGPSASVLVDQSVPTLVAEPEWTQGATNTLAWLDLFNTTTYTLQVATDKDFTDPTDVLVAAPATSQEIINLADGTTYWYRLQANKAGVLTAWSAATSSTQDATAPSGTIQIGDGATTYTTTNQVQLTLSATDPAPAGKLASGVADMRLSDDNGATWTAWEPYATTRAWTFSAAMDGVRTVTVEYRDNAGNIQSASDSITVDLGSPVVVSTTPALLGPTNADSINVAVGFSEAVQGLNSASDVTLDLNGVTIGSMAFAGLTTETYNTTYTVTLNSIDGDGTFTLTVNESAAFDAVGNPNAAGAVSAVVKIDNTAPLLGPLTGTKVVASSNFVIRWPVVQDPSGIAPYRFEIATDAEFTNIVRTGTMTGVTLIHAGTEGVVYWVRVCAEDKAGNVGPWAVDWVLYDNSAPTVASILPLTEGPTSSTAEFLVTFNEPVTGFEELADVATTYTGTVASAATTITALSETEYVVTLSGLTGAGTVAISVPAGAAENLAGLPNEAFGPSEAIEVAEFVAPVLTAEPEWSSSPNTIAWTTATFATAYVAESATDAAFTTGVTSQTVTGLEATFADLTNGQTYWYRVKATDGVVETGWSNVTSTTIDATAPSVTITSTVSDPTSQTAIPITIAFSEPVTGFEAGDIVAVGATVADFTAVSATTYTAVLNVTLTADGVVTADIAAGVAFDQANTPNTAAAQFKINYQHYVEPGNPTVVLSSPAVVTNVSPIPVTATFDQDVTGFDETDLVLENGTVANFTAVSATVYTFDVVPTADGLVTALVPADAALSALNKGNVASNLLSVVYDTTAPTVAMTSSASNPTTATVIPLLVTFNEPVTGFAADDIVTSNATVTDFTVPADGDGTTYTANLNVTLTESGLVTADIPAGAASDLAGNPNAAAPQFSCIFLVEVPGAPLPVITTTVQSPTSISPIPVTVTFDLAVTGFDASDVTVTNGAAGNFVAVSETVYTFDVTPAADGAVTVSVPAGVALSSENVPNQMAVPLVVEFLNPAPTVVLTASVTTTTSPVIPVTATFSEPVTDFAAEDVTVSQGATVENFATVDNITFTFDVVVVATADTQIDVQVPAGVCVDSLGKANEASNLVSVLYIYTPAPTVVLTAGVTTTSERSIPVTATFSEAVSGFDAADLAVLGATVDHFASETTTTYTFDLVVTAETDTTITVQVPAGVCLNVLNVPNEASNLLTIGYVYDINSIPLPAPTGVIASDGEYTFKTRVQWNAVEGAGFYKVYRTQEGTDMLEAITDWVSVLAIDDQTGVPGVTYLYQVRAASTAQGGRQSELSEADAGWIALMPTPTTAWYKIQYANCTLDEMSTSVSLEFTGTNARSSIKIMLLPKGKPASATDVPGKVAYRELASLDSVTVDGDLKAFYTTVNIESLESTGAMGYLKSVTTKNANISLIDAYQVGTVKINAAKNSTGATPEYPSTAIYTTGSTVKAKIALTGSILAELDTLQPVAFVKSATKKHVVKTGAVRDYRISLGGIGSVLRVVNEVSGQQPAEPFPMGSVVRAQSIGTLGVAGSAIVADLIEAPVAKITAKSGLYKVTNTGVFPSPKPSFVVLSGNICATQIVSSDTLKVLQAAPKKINGVLYGGRIGAMGDPSQMTVLAPNIGTVAGKGGLVSGLFIAGYNVEVSEDGPIYTPNFSGAIKKIDATKTGQLWGAAYLNPSLAAKLKLIPTGSANFQVNPVE